MLWLSHHIQRLGPSSYSPLGNRVNPNSARVPSLLPVGFLFPALVACSLGFNIHPPVPGRKSCPRSVSFQPAAQLTVDPVLALRQRDTRRTTKFHIPVVLSAYCSHRSLGASCHDNPWWVGSCSVRWPFPSTSSAALFCLCFSLPPI